MNRKKVFLFAIGGAVLLCATFATAIIRSSAHDTRSSADETPARPRPPQPTIISLRLTRNGFEPAQLTVPAGEYSFAINNRTERRSLQLSLDRQNGPRLKQVKMDLEKLNWHGRAMLTPGRYIVSAAEDPRWLCEITVTTP